MSSRGHALGAAMLGLACAPLAAGAREAGGWFYAAEPRVARVSSADAFVRAAPAGALSLVEFFAPWCGHCQAFKKEWLALTARLALEAPSLRVGAVDCVAERAECERARVDGFPTIRLYGGGGGGDGAGGKGRGVESEAYEGARTGDRVADWALERARATEAARPLRLGSAVALRVWLEGGGGGPKAQGAAAAVGGGGTAMLVLPWGRSGGGDGSGGEAAEDGRATEGGKAADGGKAGDGRIEAVEAAARRLALRYAGRARVALWAERTQPAEVESALAEILRDADESAAKRGAPHGEPTAWLLAPRAGAGAGAGLVAQLLPAELLSMAPSAAAAAAWHEADAALARSRGDAGSDDDGPAADGAAAALDGAAAAAAAPVADVPVGPAELERAAEAWLREGPFAGAPALSAQQGASLLLVVEVLCGAAPPIFSGPRARLALALRAALEGGGADDGGTAAAAAQPAAGGAAVEGGGGGGGGLTATRWTALLDAADVASRAATLAGPAVGSCAGSTAGFTCGLWLLMHAAVGRARDDADARRAVEAVIALARDFFACTACSRHFVTLAAGVRERLAALVETGAARREGQLWLWRSHNAVNARLTAEAAGGGARAKPPRPLPAECARCAGAEPGSWDEAEVVRWLSDRFGPGDGPGEARSGGGAPAVAASDAAEAPLGMRPLPPHQSWLLALPWGALALVGLFAALAVRGRARRGSAHRLRGAAADATRGPVLMGKTV
jgi:thiol-disulfide isomerase/thioredoxin